MWRLLPRMSLSLSESRDILWVLKTCEEVIVISMGICVEPKPNNSVF